MGLTPLRLLMGILFLFCYRYRGSWPIDYIHLLNNKGPTDLYFRLMYGASQGAYEEIVLTARGLSHRSCLHQTLLQKYRCRDLYSEKTLLWFDSCKQIPSVHSDHWVFTLQEVRLFAQKDHTTAMDSPLVRKRNRKEHKKTRTLLVALSLARLE